MSCSMCGPYENPPNRLRTLRVRSTKKSWRVVVVTSWSGNVTPWIAKVPSPIQSLPVWIETRGVCIGRRPGWMQPVTCRLESGHPPIGCGGGCLGGCRGSFGRAPLSVRTRTGSLGGVARRLESVPGRTANGTLPRQRRSPSIGAAPVWSRRSPLSIRSGHGCFGTEPSSIRPPARPSDSGPSLNEEGHRRIEEGPVSLETGAASMRRGRVSIEGGRGSIRPCWSSIERGSSSIQRGRFSIERGGFSIERGSFWIGAVPFSSRRVQRPRNRERFARLQAKAAGDGEPCWRGAGRPPRLSH